jgi:hypothetical protein
VVTPHLRAYLGSAILTKVMSRSSISWSTVSSSADTFSQTSLSSSSADKFNHRFKKKIETKLTEEDGNKVVFVQQLVEHFAADLLDFILELENVLRGQPAKNAVGVEEITIVDEGSLFPVVNQARNSDDVVLGERLLARNFDKVDAVIVGVAVDLLEGCQNLLAIFVAVLIIFI